jgi:hydroxymethylpyrimidine pyrophosphatase-like HAD family hydrolase
MQTREEHATLPLSMHFAAMQASVAMGNADDAVKEVATWVAPSNNDDGFAAAVNKLLDGDFDA